MLKNVFQAIKAHRSKQGQRYDLPHVLLLTILAMLSNATSYRKIHSFVSIHFDILKVLFDVSWTRAPAYTTIRSILKGMSPEEAEEAMRHATQQMSHAPADDARFLSSDGKALRHSFDHVEDQQVAHLLSVFSQEDSLILAHLDLTDTPNEIPVIQHVLQDAGFTNCVVTVDALHCQAETLKATKDGPNEVIVQVKVNQPNLLKDCQRTTEMSQAEDVYVTLQEDASRIRINPAVFARLRSLILNILRSHKVTNICKELYENSLKFERL